MNNNNINNGVGSGSGTMTTLTKFIFIALICILVNIPLYFMDENCYYLTCVHKMHVVNDNMELLEDFIKGRCDCNEGDGII